MSITARRCSALLLLVALVIGCRSSADDPPGPAPGPEDPLLTDLRGTDRGRRIRALVFLCRRGLAGLTALEGRVGGWSGDEQARAVALVSLSLLEHLDVARLDQLPRLKALAEPGFARGRAAAAPLMTPTVYDRGEGPDLPPGARHTPGPVEQAHATLYALGGLAVPAGLALAASSNPVARAHGARLLGRLRAFPQRAVLERLERDGAGFRAHGSDFVERSSVGAIAREQRWRAPTPKYATALRIEALIAKAARADGVRFGSELINGIRQTSGAFTVTDWDAWWTAAEPAWTAYWRLHSRKDAYQAFRDWQSARKGYRLRIAPSADGRSVLKIDAPAQSRIVVLRYDVRSKAVGAELGQATTRFEQAVEPGTGHCWMIRVVLKDGRRWERGGFYVRRGHTVTMTVDPDMKGP